MSAERPAPGRITAKQLELLRRLREGAAGLPKEGPPPIRPAAPAGPATRALSPGESQLWFLDRVAPGGAEYHVPLRVEVPSGTGTGAVLRGLAALGRRHEALRTSFPEESPGTARPVRRVATRPPAAAVVDLSRLSAARASGEMERLAADEAMRPFDLERGPLARAVLLVTGAGEPPQLHWTFHHAVVDGASLEILLTELAGLLDTAPAESAESAAPRSSEWVAAQAAWLGGAEAREVRERRLRELREGLAYLPLPFDRPPIAASSAAGGTVDVSLSACASAGLEGVAQEHGATPFMAGCALYAVLLSRLAGASSFGVGVAVANRHGGDDLRTVGLLANMVPIRVDLEGVSAFAELLTRTREASLAAFAAQRYPFERLVEDLAPERQPGRNPLFQVSYSMRREEPWSRWSRDEGLRVTEVVTPAAKFDLSLDLWRSGDRLEGRLWYRTDLFDRTTVARIGSALSVLAEEAARRPDAPVSSLSVLSASEHHQVTAEWSWDTAGWVGVGAADWPVGELVPERIASRAGREPGRVAVVAGGVELSYGDLLARADALAWRLWHAGAGPESRVGVCLERGASLVAALLGVWRAGAAYVPLDPAYPRERLAFMLEDSGAQWVVTDEALAEELSWPEGVRRVRIDEPHGGPATLGTVRCPGAPPVRRDPDHLSHVIYTSGSTGRPKGVGIRHGGVASLVRWAAGVYGEEELSGMLAATSVCFDLSVFELFAPLALGGRVIVAENALSLPSLPARGEVRLVNTVPSTLGALLRTEEGLPPGVRTVNLAGEALHGELARRILSRPGVVRLFNLYGPSEDTTYSTGAAIAAGVETPGIGRGLPGTRTLVLDEDLAPVPAGVAGELCLGGEGLARGYLGRPARTAESFVPDPFGGRGASAPGSRIYRTGDRVRRSRDGGLEYLGRRDGQVKVRGFRIELGEVEAALVERPEVAEAAVVVERGESAEDARLVAYAAVPSVAADGGAAGDAVAEAILSALRDRLPHAMVPSRLTVLPELPHTPSGKIDRRALPRPTAPRSAADDGRGAAPRDPVEELIAGLWSDLLGIETIGPDDDFFALGGHSLQATRVIARVRRDLGVSLPLRAVFEHPTPARLAARIAAERRADRAAPPTWGTTARPARLPLSFGQRRLWFLDRLAPGSSAYNVPVALRLTGELDRRGLAWAVGALARRHESLRTTFAVEEDEPRLEIAPPSPGSPLRRVDLECLPPERRAAEAGRIGAAEAARPFDLARGPLFRPLLLSLSRQEHLLIMVLHHAVADWWSLGVLFRELELLYGAARGGGRSEPPAPSVQYADYALWQRRTLSGPVLEAEVEHWRRLQAPSAPRLLPDRSPVGDRRPERGLAGEVPFHLPEATVAALRRLARSLGATPFMVLLAAFQALLGRLSGSLGVAVGTPIANRDRPETESLVGFLGNTLVLRADLSDDPPFAELVTRVRDEALEAYDHAEVPFELLVERLAPEREVGRTPFFQVLVSYQQELAVPRLDGVEARLEPLATGRPKLDLSVVLGEKGSGDETRVAGSIVYDTALWDRSSIERFAARFRAFLRESVTSPDRRVGDLGLCLPAERALLRGEGSEEAERLAEPTVPEVFARTAREAPDRVALVCGARRLSYGALASRAGGLAARLREVGSIADRPVAILLDRSQDYVVAILGVLAAGAAYLPLDPAEPPVRLAAVLREAAPAAVVTDREHAGLLRGLEVPIVDPGTVPVAQDLFPPGAGAPAPGGAAYAIYTSGSTGRPKGVVVEHRQLAAYVAGVVRRASLDPGWSYATVSSFATDLGHTSVFPALATGGTLHVIERHRLFDPHRLREIFEREPVDVLKIVPSHLAAMLAEVPEGHLLPARRLILGGEAAAPTLLARVTGGGGPRVLNHYGPTETTVGVATWSLGDGATRWDDDGPAPIGRALPGDRLVVADRALRAVPIGAPGELCVGGAGVARGYLHRPAATAERFVPDPFSPVPGARLYRTGDRCVAGADGAVRFLGRIDDQVKIRGFRVEPGELEAVLEGLDGIEDAAVVVRRGDPPHLAAFVVGSGGAVSVEALRRRLRERLPEAMVPSEIHRVAAIPRTAAGKRDRRALERSIPASTGAATSPAPAAVSLPGETARSLADIWRRLLGVERVGPDDNFFDLGGHSLLLVRLQGAIRRELGAEVSVIDLFAHPTVASQARLLGAGEAPGTARRDAFAASAAPARERSRGVAVVGMAGRFPGARDLDELWRNLLGGVESIRSFSPEEEQTSRLDPALLELPGYVNARGVIADVELFDADFFGFRPREAALTDPQQRVFLECAWEALEDAGHRPEELSERTGLFAGAGANTYLQNHLFGNPAVGPHVYGMEARIGNDKDFLTTRVSYKLDLQGPSVAVQSSCSTSLVAIHMACRALLEGECDLALAGGVRIALPQATGYLYEEGGVTSPDGHCRPFDARARGMVPGNGAGVVVLRRLEDALADGDPVRAVILGSAVNNDGARKVGYAAPSVEGQARVLEEARRAAGVEAASIALVEAHGTGTPLGDPIEVEALTRVFGATGSRFLGSIKSNIGHLDTAAGVAGLIKTVLALERGTVPPTAHFERPNPELHLERSGFRVPSRPEEWPAGGSPRRAGVSSFGIGGTNAHAVLEEAPPRPPADPPRRERELLVLSARSPAALERAAGRLAERLRGGLEAPYVLADVAHTLQIGRRTFGHRAAVLAATTEEAVAALARARPARAEADDGARVVFLFPGQGSPQAGAVRAVYETEERFRASLDRSREVLRAVLDQDLFDLLLPRDGATERAAADLRQTRYAQPALVALELALARLWEAWGVRPAAVAGHSVGELSAACVAGVFDDESAVLLAAERGALMQEMPAGAMLAVPLGEADLRPLLDDGVEVAAINAPDRSVVSGPEPSIAALAARIAADRGVECRPLAVSHAFHSVSMEAAAAPFVERVAGRPRSRPSVPWISSASGEWVSGDEAVDAERWGVQMRRPVRFSRALERLLEIEGGVLLEVGPGRALSTFARRVARASGGSRQVRAAASMPDGSAGATTGPFEALGELWTAGVEPDWRAVRAEERRLRVPLPTYPFERRRYWFEPVPRPHVAVERAAVDRIDLAEEERPDLEVAFVAPRDEVETAIADVWRSLFGLSRVGAEDDFFDLGGDSLLAAQIVAGVRSSLGVEVTAAQLFEERTVAGLAVRAREGLAGRTERPGGEPSAGVGPAATSMDDIYALLDEVEALEIGTAGGTARKGDR